MNIFVVGSAPRAVFPDVPPDKIYAVNGAISRVGKYSSKAQIIGVISRSVIFSKDELDVKTRALWHGQKVDRVIVTINTGWSRTVSDEANFLESKLKALGLEFNSFCWAGNRYRYKILLSRRVCRLTSEIWHRLKAAWPNHFLHEIKRSRYLPELGISGGIRTLVVADEEAPFDSKIFLIGIGARKSKGHFYDEAAPFILHARNDLNFLVDFVKNKPQKLIVTDRVLERFLRQHASS